MRPAQKHRHPRGRVLLIHHRITHKQQRGVDDAAVVDDPDPPTRPHDRGTAGRAQLKEERLQVLRDPAAVEEVDAHDLGRLPGRERERPSDAVVVGVAAGRGARRRVHGRVRDRDRVQARLRQTHNEIDEAVHLTDHHIRGRKQGRLRDLAGIAGADTTTPLESEISARSAPLKSRAKLSEPSGEPSSLIGTSTVFAVSPGAKVSVPEVVV